MNTREKVTSSLSPLLTHPSYVSINQAKLKEVAVELLNYPVPPWDNDLQFLGTPEETAQYYFFLDSINFCFWAPKGETRWEYKIDGEWVGGYYAYSRAIKDAFLRDRRFFEADYLASISKEDFEGIFSSGRNHLLLPPERHSIIRENFSILKDRFEGKAINLIIQAEGDTDKLVNLLVEDFPSFRDVASYNNQDIYFLKRAQIFPSDLFFTGLKELKLENLENLTVFADYKLPQILESLGVLTYSQELNSDIVEERLIPAGSIKEMELRANSIVAIENIREEMEKLGRKLSTNELDWILWVKAKQSTFNKPHHKTLTTFY